MIIFPAFQTPVPPSDVTYPLDGSKIVKINGRIRLVLVEVGDVLEDVAVVCVTSCNLEPVL